MDATGVVLAGGLSCRFGSNKALAPWKNGKPLIESVIDTLISVFPQTLLIAKNAEEFQFLNRPGLRPSLRMIHDLTTEFHPLGGILSGLFYSRTDRIFVSGCDMPHLQPTLIEKIWEKSHGFEITIPIWHETPQPLCAIYSQKCWNAIQKMIEQKQFKIQDLLDHVHTRYLTEKEVLAVDPAGLSFMDIDTKEDYEKIYAL